MKKLIAMLSLLTILSACSDHTVHGKCLGVLDTKDPAFEYSWSGNNVFWAVVFSETLVVPLVVVFDQFTCPVARK